VPALRDGGMVMASLPSVPASFACAIEASTHGLLSIGPHGAEASVHPFHQSRVGNTGGRLTRNKSRLLPSGASLHPTHRARDARWMGHGYIARGSEMPVAECNKALPRIYQIRIRSKARMSFASGFRGLKAPAPSCIGGLGRHPSASPLRGWRSNSPTTPR